MNTKKKVLTIIVFILFVIVFVLAYFLFQKYVIKSNFERDILPFANKNDKTVFEVNKIVLFSNCDAKNKTGSASNFTIENLYQFTDLAIFINHSSIEEKTAENTFKKVCIKNIQYPISPELGNPKLFFKGLNHFAKSDFILENEIHDTLDFMITSENEANLDTPTLFNNLANPITLSYINQNIKTDYTITDTTTPITYDGSLLKRCHIDLSSITCKLSFDLYITNNLDEEFKTTVFIDIPLTSQDQSILDGNLNITLNTNFAFYRYQ
ncbi:MAG: hypothetical protein HFJ33_03175 [Clostridia bacterium]|nr:hypothetical protein [Clostridia bacterium]